MSTKKLFILLVIPLVLAGCAAQQTGDTGAEAQGDAPAIALTDMLGREIHLQAPVQRAVALTAADCEIIYALGAEEVLVARGEYCDYPREVLEVPAVQSGADLNIEQIIALDPDVLFMGTMAQSDEQIAALEAAGITVIISDAADISGVYVSIDMIGQALGRQPAAKELVEDMQARFSVLRQRVEALDISHTIYFEVSPLEWGLWTAGKDTFMDEIAQLLKVENIFDDVSGWAGVSQEQVIQRNPDYIISVAMRFDDGPSPEDEIRSRNGWQSIRAVENGDVYQVDSDEFSRPGPRLADAAELLYAILYEE